MWSVSTGADKPGDYLGARFYSCKIFCGFSQQVRQAFVRKDMATGDLSRGQGDGLDSLLMALPAMLSRVFCFQSTWKLRENKASVCSLQSVLPMRSSLRRVCRVSNKGSKLNRNQDRKIHNLTVLPTWNSHLSISKCFCTTTHLGINETDSPDHACPFFWEHWGTVVNIQDIWGLIKQQDGKSWRRGKSWVNFSNSHFKKKPHTPTPNHRL